MEIESGNQNYATVDKYQLTKLLGSGYHAKVKEGRHMETNQTVAIKIFKNTHSFQNNLQSLQHEVGIMEKLNHPNLVNLVECKQTQYKKKNGSTYECLIIALELAQGGELFEYVARTGRYSEPVTRYYFKQLLDGLEYMHKKNIAHRDLKPENILYDKNFNLRIADFGFAKQLDGGLTKTVLGTESYMAPEIHNKQAYSGTQVDLFAACIITFIMYAGTPPFSKAHSSDPYYKLLINNKHNTFWKAHNRNKPGNDFFSQDFQSFMNAMFAFDPNSRLSMAEIRSHPWFKGPTATKEQIFAEFSQRNQKVEAELNKERQAKKH